MTSNFKLRKAASLLDNRTLLLGTFIMDNGTLYKVLVGVIIEKNDEKLGSFSHRAKDAV